MQIHRLQNAICTGYIMTDTDKNSLSIRGSIGSESLVCQVEGVPQGHLNWHHPTAKVEMSSLNLKSRLALVWHKMMIILKEMLVHLEATGLFGPLYST